MTLECSAECCGISSDTGRHVMHDDAHVTGQMCITCVISSFLSAYQLSIFDPAIRLSCRWSAISLDSIHRISLEKTDTVTVLSSQSEWTRAHV